MYAVYECVKRVHACNSQSHIGIYTFVLFPFLKQQKKGSESRETTMETKRKERSSGNSHPRGWLVSSISYRYVSDERYSGFNKLCKDFAFQTCILFQYIFFIHLLHEILRFDTKKRLRPRWTIDQSPPYS